MIQSWYSALKQKLYHRRENRKTVSARFEIAVVLMSVLGTCYEENEGELRRVDLLFERTTTGTSSIVDSSGALKSLTHLHFFSALVRKLL